MRKFLLAGLLTIALVSPTQAQQKLYVSNGSGLFVVDPFAGTLTSVGPFGAPIWQLTATGTGGTIYGTDQTGKRIYTIDPNTGHATPLPSPTGVNAAYASLSFANGGLYLLTFGRIYRVNLSGSQAGASVTEPGPSFLGCATGLNGLFGAETGGGGNLWILDPTSGAAEIVCINPFGSGVNALSFDANNLLYGALPDPNGYNTSFFIWNVDTDCSAFTITTINSFDCLGMTWR